MVVGQHVARTTLLGFGCASTAVRPPSPRSPAHFSVGADGLLYRLAVLNRSKHRRPAPRIARIPVVVDTSAFRACLELDRDRDGRYWRRGRADAGAFAFAGLLSAQIVSAVGVELPEAQLRSIASIYMRAVRPEEDYSLAVDLLHSGSQLGTVRVDVMQADRLCATAQVLLGPPAPRLVDHEEAVPRVARAAECPPASGFADLAGETRTVGGVDLRRSDQSVDPVFSAWRRLPGLGADDWAARAVIVHDANAFLPGTALLPHSGLGLVDAHNTIIAVITASDVVFHRSPRLEQWSLFHNRSTFAGEGWAFGRGAVYEEGRLVASYSQQAMLRPQGPHRQAL